MEQWCVNYKDEVWTFVHPEKGELKKKVRIWIDSKGNEQTREFLEDVTNKKSFLEVVTFGLLK